MQIKTKKVGLLFIFFISICVLGACVKQEETNHSNDVYLINESQSLLPQLLELTNDQIDDYIDELTLNHQEQKAQIFINIKNLLKEIGAYKTIDISQFSMTEIDNGYNVEAYVLGEKRNAKANILYELVNGQYNLTSILFTPEYSLLEKLQKAGINTLLGMFTVMLVLILISLLIGLFKYISVIEEKFKNIRLEAKDKVNKSIKNTDNKCQNNISNKNNIEDDIDLEIIAVISASIASYEGKSSSDSLVVRSIKRVR